MLGVLLSLLIVALYYLAEGVRVTPTIPHGLKLRIQILFNLPQRWHPALSWFPGQRHQERTWRFLSWLSWLDSKFKFSAQISEHHSYLLQYAGCASATLFLSAIYNAGTYRWPTGIIMISELEEMLRTVIACFIRKQHCVHMLQVDGASQRCNALLTHPGSSQLGSPTVGQPDNLFMDCRSHSLAASPQLLHKTGSTKCILLRMSCWSQEPGLPKDQNQERLFFLCPGNHARPSQFLWHDTSWSDC